MKDKDKLIKLFESFGMEEISWASSPNMNEYTVSPHTVDNQPCYVKLGCSDLEKYCCFVFDGHGNFERNIIA